MHRYDKATTTFTILFKISLKMTHSSAPVQCLNSVSKLLHHRQCFGGHLSEMMGLLSYHIRQIPPFWPAIVIICLAPSIPCQSLSAFARCYLSNWTPDLIRVRVLHCFGARNLFSILLFNRSLGNISYGLLLTQNPLWYAASALQFNMKRTFINISRPLSPEKNR